MKLVTKSLLGERRAGWWILFGCLIVVCELSGSAYGKSTGSPTTDFILTVLHNNDGESQLVDLSANFRDFGGVARFKTVVDRLKRDATPGPPPHDEKAVKRGVVMLASGDNSVAAPEFDASLNKGVPYFDTIAMDLIGYDAIAIGNHDFFLIEYAIKDSR